MSPRILVIEDDPDIARLLRIHLADMGCSVEVAVSGESGLARAKGNGWDLVMLDLVLPGIDGFEVCQQLRSLENYVPILMLTSRDAEVDRVVGLEMGADDYVTKPFSIRELMARVKAMLRRAEAMRVRPEGCEALLTIEDLRVDVGRREVWIDERGVELTAKEFDLLALFARHPGRVYTRSQLLDRVWGYGHEGCEHTVNSHINRLRAKIEDDPRHPRFIITVWGVGYKLREPRG